MRFLIVGTFNGDIEGNLATWFYGRPENEFWCLFPRMSDKPSLHPVDQDENINELTFLWKQFCVVNKVIIVDLFKEVLIELPNHGDTLLTNLESDQYIAFDFETAFANCRFRKVMFTWKGMETKHLDRFQA
jgi:G:T/U-mismatch repair DNA glycosylase